MARPAIQTWLKSKRMAFAWLGLAALIVVLDIWTKDIASAALALYRPHALTSWLNLTLAHNYGAAFSFLNSAGGWQRWFFIVLATAVTVVLIVWLLRLPAQDRLTGLALSLVIGGALGNLIDRIGNGYVVDFIDVHYRGAHWPAFNLADSAITCGVILLLVSGIFLSKPSKVDNTG